MKKMIFFLLVTTIIVIIDYAKAQDIAEKPIKKGFLAYIFTPKKMPVVSNEKLRNACKECHWVQLPGLLPSKSWKKVMNNLDDHFGDTVRISENDSREILEYLSKNAAEFTDSKVSIRLVQGIGGDSTIEISKVGYIKKIHEDIKEELWNHPDIKSRANCIACHKETEVTGVFDEHSVELPEGYGG